MGENSGASEISGDGRENEVGKSVTVAVTKENEEKNETGNCVTATVAGVPVTADVPVTVGVCRDLSANRWPQQETMALLRIRSEMDAAFKGSGLKSWLWEEISRKMAAIGYHRSAKKCKEKFENIYKYHKRMKNTSSGRSTGKSYRFSNELEALDDHQIALQNSADEQIGSAVNDPATAASPISSNPPYIPQMATPVSLYYDSSHFTTSTSTTSCSGSESEGTRIKKRKWTELFDKMMTSVLEKQEYLQNKFLEAIDKCEHERLAREEAWKIQELDRIKRQQELLVQERSITAAKDAAVMAFLQKISEKGMSAGNSGQMNKNWEQEMQIDVCKTDKNDGENSSSRWPKEEVEALIRIKTKVESEHQRLGPLWEDISIAMENIGYDRSAKKCKEKWENINKYYRKVKERSNKQRRLDSKTCPYFHLLDSLYNMKTTGTLENSVENSAPEMRHGDLLLHMINHSSGQQQQHEQVVVQQ